MVSVPEARHVAKGGLAAAITALMVWFGTGLDPWWPLLWFAALPVLLISSRLAWPGAAGVAASGWLLGHLNMWHYFHDVIKVPLLFLLALYAVQTLVFCSAVLLFRLLLKRGAYASALVAFPVVVVSFEYLLSVTSVHGTAGNLAYSQLGFLPFLQLASVTGLWGMTFLLLLFPAAIAIGLHLRQMAPRQALRIVSVSLGTIGAVLVFGAVRIALPGPIVKVGLVASDPPASPALAEEGAPTRALFREYAAQVEKLIAQGAQIVVLPEKLGVLVDPDTADVDTMFQSLADRTGATIVVGLIRVSPPIKFNQARVYAARTSPRDYNKEHLLPPFESRLEPGHALSLLSDASGTWGVAICKDMDFTSPSRAYGLADVGLMLVPAWDFGLDRIWHGHLAIMRGVESGFSIVRAAKQGYLTVSDARGRIIAETQTGQAPFTTLLADVSTMHHATLYVLLGDWFAWVVLAALAIVLVRAYRYRHAKAIVSAR